MWPCSNGATGEGLCAACAFPYHAVFLLLLMYAAILDHGGFHLRQRCQDEFCPLEMPKIQPDRVRERGSPVPSSRLEFAVSIH